MKWMWFVACISVATILVITGRAALAAHSNASHARIELATVTEQARELVRLRMQTREDVVPQKPAGGLAGRISAALARAGLIPSMMQSLSPEAESPAGRFIKQRATLTLSGLSLPQLGSFLDAWRGSEPDWTISGIDLSPIMHSKQEASGTDLPLRAVLTLEGLFKEPPPLKAPTGTLR